MSADFDLLFQRYLDGSIDAEGMTRLNEMLETDADARRRFAEGMNLESALATQALDWSAGQAVGLRPRVTSRRGIGRVAGVLAAAAACAALAVWVFSSRDFATVEDVVGIPPLAPGAHLRGERHVIPHGTLALVTARGARVVVEAPAEFQFESAQRLRLARGRLSAEVPPAAKGFTVITPSGEAVDLGTRFGVDVPDAGEAEVHVFAGEVVAHAAPDRQRSLRTGDAAALTTGGPAARELRSAAFIQPAEVGDLSAGLAAGQRTRAEAALAGLRTDTALIALLDFESGDEPGSFRTVQGRWPGSRAPEFVRVGDHLKLDLGGDRSWPRLSLAAWVRLDRLDSPYQSLLHTDGWQASNPGQVHWMVNRFSTMRLALKGNTLAPGSPEPDSFPDSRTPVLPEIGRWMHLAVVYDSVAQTTRFFLNGRFDGETREATAHPARLGPAQIGNWNRIDRKLSGRIDELLILGRAMSDAEVSALFQAGNPYR